MEEFQEQEYEFLRRLDEDKLDRRRLLKRGLAAGAGLTILSAPASALAARQKALANPPLRGKDVTMKELVAEAKKEGHLNLIATPPEWANYGEIIPTFSKKYGIPNTVDNPEGSSGEEVQAVISLKGQSRAPDAVDVAKLQTLLVAIALPATSLAPTVIVAVYAVPTASAAVGVSRAV